MKRKWLSILLAAALALSLVPGTAFAAEIVASGYCGGEGDGSRLTWTLDNDIVSAFVENAATVDPEEEDSSFACDGNNQDDPAVKAEIKATLSMKTEPDCKTSASLESESNPTVEIKLVGEIGGSIVVSFYNAVGQMQDVQVRPAEDAVTVSFDLTEGVDYATVMWVDEDWNPICDSVRLELNAKAKDEELQAYLRTHQHEILQPEQIIQGRYTRSGALVEDTHRLRLDKFIPVVAGDVVHFVPGTNTEGILCGFVNDFMKVKEIKWTYAGTDITVPFSCQMMLLFRNKKSGVITPEQFDATVYITHAERKPSSETLFRCLYCEAIPIAESASSPYPMSYNDFIAQYDEIRSRTNSLYSSYSSRIPKPLSIEKTSLQTLDSGLEVYQYTFTPAYPKKTVLINAGMHGNEYEGMWGLYYFLRMLYAEAHTYPELDVLRKNVRFVIIPCLNPDGFEANTRTNADGINILDCFKISYSGTIPKEFSAIATAAANANFDYFLDLHTDPYTPSKGCYGYALATIDPSPTFPVLYNITNTFRDILLQEYNFRSGYKIDGEYAIVGRLGNPETGGGSVGYMYRNFGKPGNLIEIATSRKQGKSFDVAGSENVLKMTVDWYANVLLAMYREVFS